MPRHSDYSEEIADKICERLANGDSLVKICQSDEMPHRSTVNRWMAERADFATRCARTREGPQADYVFDDLSRIEDAVESGGLDPNAARVLISSKQWRAAKLAPKKYGDKLQTETTATVKVEHTRRLDISTLSDDQLDALEEALRATIAQIGPPGKFIEHEE